MIFHVTMASVQQGVSENSIKYILFTSSPHEKKNPSTEELEVIAENYISQLSSFISQYLWQNDAFNLRVVEDVKFMQPYLEGITCFDENIEDEWFIVYLLYQLTKKDSNLIVKVEDNDGEFLLIEAADYIPKWLNPETSINRVFLYQGSLHIIPIAQNPGQITPLPSGVPSITDAIEAIRQFPSITKADDKVLQAIEKRIKGYPGKIREYQHRAHCYIPAGVKAILIEEPRLLSSAVRAFYMRDPIGMKACRAMKYFPPETRIMSEVLFTRCLYAQLMNQQYEPDKRTGWNLPSKINAEFKSHDLGMKLACGFEILASSAHKTTALEEGNLIELDFSNDVRWKRFVKHLVEKGYFRGEIEGSKLHRQLMFQAKNFYIHTLKRNDSKRAISPGSQILQLLDKLSINYEELKESEKFLQSPDDDSWMEITPEKLDMMLEEKYFTKNQQNFAASVTSGLKDFLNHTSEFEGAEFPSNKTRKKQKVSLDTDAFSDAVNTILDFAVPGSDDDRSSSSMSGYTDEDDEEVDLGEEDKGVNPTKELIKDMKMYMHQMDQELDETTIGLSFEKLQSSSCIKKEDPSNLEDSVDINDEFDDFHPVDVDLTALKNILESYSSQQGLPGPAGNLFASMGVQLPQNTDT